MRSFLIVPVMLLGALSLGSCSTPTTVLAQPQSPRQSILFVGNSYTFARVDPTLHYNNASVTDLTRPRPDIPSSPFNDQTGSNPYEPHPWGGVPGIFKKLTDEAGLSYDVSLSARNAATLRGQYITGNPAHWDLIGNVASSKWDVVVLQEQSDAALPAGRGKNANLAQFNAYADKFERYIHVGAADSYTETTLFGSLAACIATGSSASACGTVHVIRQNPNASLATKVYLTQTFARPDMVLPHLITTPDLTTSSGSPIVDTSSAGGPAILYYSRLGDMTSDLHTSFYNKASTNSGFAGVVPVGDAFQRAVDLGLVKTANFYTTAGVYATAQPSDPVNLWWIDYLHESKYGAYLYALVMFGTITGHDPQSLGANESAASDLGIASSDARMLQQMAGLQLGYPLASP